MKHSGVVICMLASCILSIGLLSAVPSGQQAQAAEMNLTSSADVCLQTQSVKNYPVWVAGKRVTSKNAKDVLGNGTVSYNAKTRTLTLKHATIKKARVYKYSSAVTAFVPYTNCGVLFDSSESFTIKLVGKNKISMPTAKSPIFNYGVYTDGSLRFTGTGSLTVAANKAQCFSIGIYAGNLTCQDQVRITAKGVKTEIKNKNVGMADNYGGYGVMVENKIALKDKARVIAQGARVGFAKRDNTTFSFASGYTPSVKAGTSAKNIKVKKSKPAKSVYTKYKYVCISRASATSNKPAKMSILSVTPGGGSLSVVFKSLTSNCTGYQFQISNSNSYPSGSTVTSTVEGSGYDCVPVTNVQAGTTYYMRIRGVNKVGSKTYYGAWSAVKTGIPNSGSAVG